MELLLQLDRKANTKVDIFDHDLNDKVSRADFSSTWTNVSTGTFRTDSKGNLELLWINQYKGEPINCYIVEKAGTWSEPV